MDWADIIYSRLGIVIGSFILSIVLFFSPFSKNPIVRWISIILFLITLGLIMMFLYALRQFSQIGVI